MLAQCEPVCFVAPTHPMWISPHRGLGHGQIAQARPGRLCPRICLKERTARSLPLMPESQDIYESSPKPPFQAQRPLQGKRMPSLLRFFLLGPVWFLVWHLLKPSAAVASTTLAVAGAVGTGLTENNDVAWMLREAMQAFGMDPANPEWIKLSKTYLANILPMLPNLLFQLSICLIAFRISTVAGASLRTYADKNRNIDLTTVSFLVGLVRYSMLLIATIIVFRSLGVAPPQSFTALITSISLAIGLAFQSVLGNVAAGLMLLVFRPYSVGDKVNIGNRVGFVYDISLLTTRLDTEDNTRIQVPNSEVFKGVVENYTLNPLRRVEVPVLIAHAGSVERTRQVLQEVVSQFGYLSIAGSTQPPKDKKKSKTGSKSSKSSKPSKRKRASAPASTSEAYLESLRPRRKPDPQHSAASRPYLESLSSTKPPAARAAEFRSSNLNATSVRDDPGLDTDDGIPEDQERLMNGLGWLGGLTQRSVKPAIKSVSRGYNQLMRVAEVQYQNADISVMTKVPKPEVVLKEITPLGQKWIARVWAPSRRYNRVRCQLTEEVAKGLQVQGIPVVGLGPVAGEATPEQAAGSAYLAGMMAANER